MMQDFWDSLDGLTREQRKQAMQDLSDAMDAAGKRIELRLRPQQYCSIIGAMTVCLDMFADELSSDSVNEIRETMAECRRQLQWNFPPKVKN